MDNLLDTFVNLRAEQSIADSFVDIEAAFVAFFGSFADPSTHTITDLILALVDDENLELVADIVNLNTYFGLTRQHTLDRLFEALSIEVADIYN